MNIKYEIDTITLPARAPLSFDKTVQILKVFNEQFNTHIESILLNIFKEHNVVPHLTKMHITVEDFNAVKLLYVSCNIHFSNHVCNVYNNMDIEINEGEHLK